MIRGLQIVFVEFFQNSLGVFTYLNGIEDSEPKVFYKGRIFHNAIKEDVLKAVKQIGQNISVWSKELKW